MKKQNYSTSHRFNPPNRTDREGNVVVTSPYEMPELEKLQIPKILQKISIVGNMDRRVIVYE